jgi:hypothetical protein
MTAAQIATKAHAKPIRRLRRLGWEGVPALDWFALLEAKTRLKPSDALLAANGLRVVLDLGPNKLERRG